MTIKWFKIIKTTYITIIKGFFSILLHHSLTLYAFYFKIYVIGVFYMFIN